MRGSFAAAVIDHHNTCKTSVTARTLHVETAEEVAIAPAVATTMAEVAISDSQTARLTTPQYHIGDEDGHRYISPAAVPRDSGHASDSLAPLVPVVPNFVLASGANEWPATCRRALLLRCLGTEGQRIFNAFAAPPPSQPPLSTEATVSESTEKHTSAHTAAASPPDPYDVGVDTLAHYFTATVDVRVERHHFRERRQVSGELVAELALALPELAAPCNFAATADDNLCEQFVAGVTCPQLRERLLLEGDALTFDRAVEIVKLREQTRQEAEAFANPIRRITQRQRGRNPARHDSTRFRFNGSRPPSQHRRSSSRTRQNYKPKPETTPAEPLHAISRDNCDNCGATGCERSRCPARGRTCYGCGRRGHFQSVCRSLRRGQPRRPAPVRELLCDDDAESGHSILIICTNKRRGLYVDVDVSVINRSRSRAKSRFSSTQALQCQ
ncbi:hypothetical protein HPB51_026849 [Rhipicephalus microplus]|uniref:CCHC-type domain-containing protein n=1 Tax=Rhipicephalus microplus TaxID=6941 RepID=A0A9J6D1J3_RHIMP|nr:hypothetical protein HPB51_026849 [Rhipicephalus microplus]